MYFVILPQIRISIGNVPIPFPLRNVFSLTFGTSTEPNAISTYGTVTQVVTRVLSICLLNAQAARHSLKTYNFPVHKHTWEILIENTMSSSLSPKPIWKWVRLRYQQTPARTLIKLADLQNVPPSSLGSLRISINLFTTTDIICTQFNIGRKIWIYINASAWKFLG